ncbi:hypothetical protein ACIBQ1_58440 [Nonomuraea sp. NPDC050153]|uniref:hypothetical protein n=1 Tax=Nonomuraea sp. NPDC050153 TaxID=3364359 RepID=UPI0037A831FF
MSSSSAQLLNQRRILGRSELLYLQPAADELHRGVGAEPVQHPGIIALQRAGELGQMPSGFDLQLQRGENARPRLLPRIPVQQPGARVAPPLRPFGEHITPPQRLVQVHDRAQHERGVVDLPLRQVRVAEPQPATSPTRARIEARAQYSFKMLLSVSAEYASAKPS